MNNLCFRWRISRGYDGRVWSEASYGKTQTSRLHRPLFSTIRRLRFSSYGNVPRWVLYINIIYNYDEEDYYCISFFTYLNDYCCFVYVEIVEMWNSVPLRLEVGKAQIRTPLNAAEFLSWNPVPTFWFYVYRLIFMKSESKFQWETIMCCKFIKSKNYEQIINKEKRVFDGIVDKKRSVNVVYYLDIVITDR